MTRPSSSRWGSQLVMWSSPVLLLVMLFSMTSSAHTARSARVSPTIRPSTSVAPATSMTATTSPVPPATTHPGPGPSTSKDAATTRRPPATRAATSYAATASNAKSSASVAGALVSSGAATGALAPGEAVDVPLSGPGSWTLSASAPVTTRLACPRANTSFPDVIVIDSSQTCQLLVNSTTTITTTWRLTPRP